MPKQAVDFYKIFANLADFAKFPPNLTACPLASNQRK
ncbi:hypothetical protein MHA_2222 [Mannheimia haemolytica PHL213]|nr:hypothetical protein MHA_2222 [Mannheimia haemolytica PHL213]